MHLILGIIGENAESLGRNAIQTFGPEGGVIGRGLGCNWQLPDPTNTLSARHAQIAFKGIGFSVTDTSTNGIYINTIDAPLGRGNTAPLADGDTLYMASYIISVMIEHDPDEKRKQLGLTSSNAVRISGGTPAVPSPSLGEELPDVLLTAAGLLGRHADLPLDPLTAIDGCQSSSHSAAQEKRQAVVSPQVRDLLCLLEDEVPGKDEGSAEPDLLADSSRMARCSSAVDAEMPPAHARLREPPFPLPQAETSFDEPLRRPPTLFKESSAAQSTGRPAPIIPEGLEIGDLLPGVSSFGVAPPASPRETNWCLDAPSAPFQVAPNPLSPASADRRPMSAPGASDVRPGQRGPDGAGVINERAARRPIDASQAHDATPIAASLSPAGAPAESGELQELWNVLGIDPECLPSAQRREVLAEVGRAVTEMANGLQSLLAAWTIVKGELKIEPARARAGDNNAFKFMKSGHSALRETLAKHHAFLPLSQSVREGFYDIKAHEAAAIAAMRAGVTNVLTHMSPQRIESDGARKGLFGTRINKAKLWDRFVELHASMVNDVDRAVRTHTAEEFARAYDSRLSALGPSGRKAP
ncbi:type VI secretion system-associated FHA domain protein TagH [Bradyrhizobium sp. Ec3.3]|uniref:type VI secretion system-associated FHA domain protein TagH n=1 Tax=Bradyrhizobium sp. Ec3.3 TaxID=189753 RepID=UPI000425193F|nr:type VI secretion system-associated FHA domain protein TagH [Bradyrhizobium sp. Ec3.3]